MQRHEQPLPDADSLWSWSPAQTCPDLPKRLRIAHSCPPELSLLGMGACFWLQMLALLVRIGRHMMHDTANVIWPSRQCALTIPSSPRRHYGCHQVAQGCPLWAWAHASLSLPCLCALLDALSPPHREWRRCPALSACRGVRVKPDTRMTVCLCPLEIVDSHIVSFALLHFS